MDYTDFAWGTPPWEETPKYECENCQAIMEKDSGFCSSTCFEASML